MVRALSRLALAAAIAVPGVGAAQYGGGMMGGGGMMSGGGMMGGAGMLVVADDGSLLVTQTDAGGMMGGSTDGSIARELVNVGPDGAERWRVAFDDGWPMMPVTQGDLVVFTLADDAWMGRGGGDSGWGGWDGGSADATFALIALDLATGAERWRVELEGGMGMVQLAPDGSRIYVTLRTRTGSWGGGPMHQGGSSGGWGMTSTVVALDRDGNELWRADLGGSGTGGGGGGMHRARPVR